jgi:hypothetical protein
MEKAVSDYIDGELDKPSGFIARSAEADYWRARRKAFWRMVLSALRGKSNELIPYEEIKDRLRLSSYAYRGMQTIPIDRIVGSVGRFRDFDRAFLPTQTHTRQRWQRVDRAHYRFVNLPPIQVFQVGEVYFVRDGNHRVSVARQQGIEFIDAEVIAVTSPVPVTADVQEKDLVILGEQTAFLEATRLNELRPESEIAFSLPGHYCTLLEHVSVHRYFMGLEQEREISCGEAVAHWFDTVYLPVVEIIRQQQILKEFPGRTEADLYLWIMDHLHYLRQQYGQVDMAEAAEEFAEAHSQRPIKRLVRSVKHAVEEIIEETSPPGIDLEGDGVFPVIQDPDTIQEE